MGLDLYFYKKGFVELDVYGNRRDRELFDYIRKECRVVYGDEEYVYRV